MNTSSADFDFPQIPPAGRAAAFVDTSVAGWEALADGLPAGMEVVYIDGARDGLAQLAQWAATHHGYDALHILSHGAPGRLSLGSSELTAASLAQGEAGAQLAALGRALNPGGDLLLYGCSVGSGAAGSALIDTLAQLTGADVAASVNATGAAALHGDWLLEAQHGVIQAPALQVLSYSGLLSTFTFANSDGDMSYSNYYVLRQDGTSLQYIRFTGDPGYNIGTDMTAFGDFLFCYDTSTGNGVKLTLTVDTSGYTFDLASFKTYSDAANSVTFQLTYGDGSTGSFSSVINVNTPTTLTGLATTLDDVKQVVITAPSYVVFNDFAISDVKYYVPKATVSAGEITYTSSGTGTGGVYKIGDVVTAAWDNTTATGDGNGSGNASVSAVSMDFSQFGGGTVAATSSGNVWSASYTIVAGSIDAGSRHVAVSATNSGGTSSVSSTATVTMDNVAPTVTDAKIAISGASGTGGAFKIGDTVTASWNNSGTGDNNTDTLSAVTVDFSQFGGGSAVSATNSSGTWSATYTIVSGAIDGTSKNVSFSVTDNAGNVKTTSDSSNATLDNIAPTLTDARISISGASGTGGAFKIGDTVTATWNNTAGGDNNSDTISGVTFDFSQFGGGSAVSASNSSGTWTATYTITAGALNGSANRNVAATVTDNAGNTTTTADTSNATVDNVAPTITFSGVALSADSGSSGSDFITNVASQTIIGTLSNTLAAGDTLYASTDNGSTWSDITSQVSGTTFTWNTTLSGSNTIKLRVSDSAGNFGTASSQAYTLDTTAPSAPSAPDMTSGTDSGSSSSDDITSNTTPTLTGTAESGSTVTLYDTDGSTVLGTATATGGNWSITASALSAGAHTLTAKATDSAGNVSSASSGLALEIDTAAPTGLGLSASTVASASSISGATLATISASDSHAITYALATGNGTNDADNGSFTISGSSLKVGGSALTAGTYHIYLSATDAAGNVGLQAFTVSVVDAPSVSSVVRAGGASSGVAGGAASVDYTVTFSESVTGVDAADFALSASGTASGAITSVSGSGSTYTVTVGSLAGDGTLRLDLNSSGTGIQNGSSVAIASGYSAGQTYTLDHTAPSVSSIARVTGATSNATSADYTVTFSESVTGVDTSDFALTAGGTAAGTISAISGSGSTYTVSVSSISGDGTLRLDLKGSGTGIADGASNAIGAGYSAGQSYTFDHTAPVVSSITRVGSASTSASSLDYTVTFAESVTGVDISDFALTAGGSASGTVSSVSGSGTTYTVSVTGASGEGTLRLDLNSSGTGISDAVSNAAAVGYSAGQSYTLDHVGPTLAISSSQSSIPSGDSATITFTFSEDPGGTFTSGDITVNGGTLGALSGSGNVRTATFTAGSVGAASISVAGASYTDAAGNSGAAASAPALTVTAAAPANTGTLVDGVPVTTSIAVDSQTGLSVRTIEVPVIASGRVDDPNTPNAGLADIPLGLGSGVQQSGLTVSLPVGAGLQVAGPDALLNHNQAQLDLVGRIANDTLAGSSSRADLQQQAASFLSSLPSGTTLQTATITLSGGGNGLSIDRGATPGSGTAVGLVIDARGLTGGTTVHLDDVEFAAVVGQVRLAGGAGANMVIGDSARQTIYLGADNDTLLGGGGNDAIGSRGGDDWLDGGADDDLVAGGEGNDTVLGGSGNDMLAGGRSTSGDWTFFVDSHGVLSARHSGPLAGVAAQETVAASELQGSAAALGFLSASSERVADVALLYSALGRLPDLAGLSFWVNAPATLATVAAQLLQSSERLANIGQQDDHAFLDTVYQQTLGRAADTAGMAFWSDVLAHGTSRADVLAAFALGAEHRAQATSADGIAVGQVKGMGETGWFSTSGNDRLEGGAGDDILAGGDGNDVLIGGDGRDTALFAGRQQDYHLLLGSDGALKVQAHSGALATLSGVEVAAFDDKSLALDFMNAPAAQLKELGLLYQSLLGRAADVAGLQWWLASGLQGQQLVAAFAQSAEAGHSSDAAFVEALYAHSGLATSAAGGIAAWDSYLASHSRAELLGAWIGNDAVQAALFGSNGLWLA